LSGKSFSGNRRILQKNEIRKYLIWKNILYYQSFVNIVVSMNELKCKYNEKN